MIWNDDDIITEALACEIMDRGACSAAMLYVGRPVGEAAQARPLAALAYAAGLLSPERLAWCKEEMEDTA